MFTSVTSELCNDQWSCLVNRYQVGCHLLHTRYFIWNYSELGGMIDPVFYALTTRMEKNNQEVDLREIREGGRNPQFHTFGIKA